MAGKPMLCCVLVSLGLAVSAILGGCRGEQVKVEGIYSPAEHSTERVSDDDPVIVLAKWAIGDQREMDPMWGVVSGFGAPEESDDFFIGSPLPNYLLDDRGVQRLSFDSFPLFNNGALVALLSFDWEEGAAEERCAPRVTPIVSQEGGELLAGSACLLLTMRSEQLDASWLLSEEGRGILISLVDTMGALSEKEPAVGSQELTARLGKEVAYARQEAKTSFSLSEGA